MQTKEKAVSPNEATALKFTKKDFESDQEVRWCPGCGDYSILAQTQRILPNLNIPKEKYVFISGIGCSSRFPYYMNTFGFHTIHGRAPAIASGIKATNPDLSVWVITGDGDGLSIGGNHLIHLLRRNLDINVILFNNRIYGLTKGQYSPTSEFGKITKSTPFGSVDHPFRPISVAIGSGATFVARTMDRDPSHMQNVIKKAAEHKGTSFIEVFQNCNIFNNGAWFDYTEKDSKPENVVYLEQGKPLIFGTQRDKGIRLNGFK
ncbi:MAG: 2-oxoacid:ferredoxin oxidoreductase subunit beta, partial [bacterium]